MKNFLAKVLVKIKPSVKDIKGLTLKEAIGSILPSTDFSCRVGNYYELKFQALDLCEAQKHINIIVHEILFNEVIEIYEVISIEEL